MVALVACAPQVTAGLETEIEQGIGNWMAEAFIAQRGRLNQPLVADWVSGLGNDLLDASHRRTLDYHFVVLDSPEANGFALPGGWVFVTAGLLETMDSEDELAAVLAHELGHIANRDFQRVLLRTALWLGLAEVLRDNERDDWVPLVQGAQLVETLSHSRRREAQADATGVRIAWEGGYDPRAMAAFLGDRPKWSYLETIFATHPHPQRRSERIDARLAVLRASDPSGALALARSLIERGRCEPAAELLAEPLPEQHEAERAALLERISDRRHPTDATDDGVGLRAEQLQSVTEANSAAEQARSSAKKPRDLAWKRLRRLWDDQQVGRALVVAQAVDPELNNVSYLLLLAQSVNLLHRAMRGANLVARTLHMRATNADELEALGNRLQGARVARLHVDALESLAGEVQAGAGKAASNYFAQTTQLARLAGEYHDSARLVAPLLIELALAGDGDPAGRLTFSRFMLIQARVRLLDDRLGHLDDATEALAGEAWRGNIGVHRLRLNLAGLEADESLRERLFAALARRSGGARESFADAWESGIAPGDRYLDVVRGSLRPRDDIFGDDLRSTQILIRIASIEVKEQVRWCAKEKGASEGAGTLAIRSAVRHPQ